MEAKLPGAPAPRRLGLGTLVTHLGEYQNPYYAHVMPIYQSAAFCFPDVETGAQTFGGEVPGYIYSRLGNPTVAEAEEWLDKKA